MQVGCQAGVWIVKDLNSSNGTFVTVRALNETQLFSGDEIVGGRTRLVVSIEGARLRRLAIAVSALCIVAPTSPQQPLSPNVARTAATSPRDFTLRGTGLNGDQAKCSRSLRRLSDGHEFALALDRLATLGRSPELSIPLPADLEVSTRHATLLFDGASIPARRGQLQWYVRRGQAGYGD